MAVPVYITNDRAATEIAIDMKAIKEVALVGATYRGATPVRIVGRSVPGVQLVRISDTSKIVNGETL